MAVICECIQFDSATSNGTQTVTLSKFTGETPKAIIIVVGNQTSTGFLNDVAMGIGVATSATSRGAISWNDDDAANSSDINYAHSGAHVIRLLNVKGTTIDWSADLDSFGTNQFVLDWDTTQGTAIKCFAFVLGGSDLTNATVVQKQTGTSTGSDAQTGVGFEANGGFAISVGSSSTPATANTDVAGCIAGWAGDGLGCAIAWSGDDNDMQNDARFRVSYGGSNALAFVDKTAASIDGRATHTTWDSDGYTLNWANATASSYYYWVLCLEGPQIGRSVTTMRTSVGTDNLSVGFQPRGALLWSIGHTTQASVQNFFNFSLGACDDTTEAVYSHSADFSDSSDTRQNYNTANTLIVLEDAAGVTDTEADWDSFSSTSVILDFTKVSGNADYMYAWGIGDAAGVTQAVGLASESDSAFAVGSGKTVSVGLASETDSAFAVGSGKTVSVGLASETDKAIVVGTPGSITGNTLWLRADDLDLAAGASVASWTSRDLNQLTLTQATTAAKPTYRTTGTDNGQPAVDFDNNDYLRAATTGFSETLGEAWIIFHLDVDPSEAFSTVIAYSDETTTNEYWSAGVVEVTGQEYLYVGYGSGNYRRDFGQRGVDSLSKTFCGRMASNGSAWQTVEVLGESGDAKVGTDDGRWLGDISGAGLTLGAVNNAGSYQKYLDGRVAEIVLYNKQLSTGERDSLESYFADRYNLDFHPFEIVVSVGLASESDTAFAVTSSKVQAVGLSAETDTAFSISIPQVIAVGLASESDSALAVSSAKTTAVGLASEADSAFAITSSKVQTVGLASEADSALAVTVPIIRLISLASETDQAFEVTAGAKIISVGLASESDSAFTVGTPEAILVGQVTESDTALAAGVGKQLAVGLATEADTAFSVSVAKSVTVGLASESDSALLMVETPGRIGSVDLWLRADDASAVGDGNAVTTWTSRDASATALTQATTMSKPVYRASGVGSQAAIEFDGTDDRLRFATTAFTTATSGECWTIYQMSGDPDESFTAFMGYSDEATANENWHTGILEISGTEYGFVGYGTSNYRRDFGQRGPNSFNKAFCLRVASNGTSWQNVENDGEPGDAKAGTDDGRWLGDITGPDSLSVGAVNNGGSWQRHFYGRVAEIVLYSKTLSTAERDDLESYFNARYNIDFHPFNVVSVGLASEADSALALTGLISVGLASESDTAFAVAIGGGLVVSVGQVTETDSALQIGNYTLTTGDGFQVVFNSTDASWSSADDQSSTATFSLHGTELGGFYVHDYGAASPTNIWTNGDFESSYTGWTGTATTGVSIQTSTYSGDYIRLARGATDIKVEQTKTVEPGRSYLMEAEYKATTGGTKWINVVPTGDSFWRTNAGVWSQVAQWQILNIGASESASTWTKIQKIFYISTGQSALNIELRMTGGAGTFELDNVHLYDLDVDSTRLSHTITPGINSVVIGSSGSNLDVTATLTQKSDRIDVTGTVTNTSTSAAERQIFFDYLIPLNPSGMKWADSFDKVRSYSTGRSYCYLEDVPLVNAGVMEWQLSSLPVGLLSDGEVGMAVGEDADTPATYKIFVNDRGLTLRYRFGLTTEHNAGGADFAFSLYKLDEADWYLRDALRKYADWHPVIYTDRDTAHGTAVFNVPTATTGITDFGARYDFRGWNFENKSGLQNQGLRLLSRPMGVEWHLAGTTISLADKHLLLDNFLTGMDTTNSFTWTTGNNQTYNTRYNDATNRTLETFDVGRQRMLNCDYHDQSGEWFTHDYTGALAFIGVSMLPSLSTPNMINGERAHWITPDIDYTSTNSYTYDGCDFDNIALAPGRSSQDYNKDNWQQCSYPLTFSLLDKAVFSQTAHQYFEGIKVIADEMHARSPVAVCHGNVGFNEPALRLYSAVLDRLGGEANHTHANMRGLNRTRRALSGQKANIEIHNLTPATSAVDEILAKSMLYGSWPAIAGLNYVTTDFNSTANRTECLVHYPHLRTLDEAGWEWVPYVTSTHTDVVIERFGNFATGDLHFCVFNESTSAKSITLTLDETALVITTTATNWDEIYPGTDASTNVSGTVTINVPAQRTEAWAVTGAGAFTLQVGQASESDTAFNVTASLTGGGGQTIAVGLASESDTALAVTSAKAVPVLLSTTFEAAGQVTPAKTVSVLLSTTFEAAGQVTAAKTASVLLSTSIEAAGQVTSLKTVSVGLATETDTAFAVIPAGPSVVVVGQSAESDTALAVTSRKTVSVLLSTTIEAAGQVIPAKTVSVLLSTTFEAAGQVTPSKTAAVGLATETDTTLAVTVNKVLEAGLATEADSALLVTPRLGLGLASETDTALPVAIADLPQFSTDPVFSGKMLGVGFAGRLLGANTVGKRLGLDFRGRKHGPS